MRSLMFAAALLASLPAVAKDFTVTMPDKDWDVTLNSLQKLPWEVSNPVILKVWEQIRAQQEPPAPAAKPEPAPETVPPADEGVVATPTPPAAPFTPVPGKPN